MAQSQRLSFDEFKLYYESTEKVVDRRLAANKWNYTTCIGTLVAIVAIMNWGLGQQGFLLIAVSAIGLLSVMAVFFCALWIGQIRDFKALNNAKFQILNGMSPLIVFSDDPSDRRVSFEPFAREWKLLEDSRALTALNGGQLVVLKSSNIEYLIPRAFRVLFAGILLFVVVFSMINRDHLLNRGLAPKVRETPTTSHP